MAKNGIGPKEPHQVTARICSGDWLQNGLPIISTVDDSFGHSASVRVGPELVEDEQRVDGGP